MYQAPFHVAMLIMGFTIIAVGIVLYIKQFGRNETNEIKILGWEFKLSNSAILIFLVGAAMVAVGYLYNPGMSINVETPGDKVPVTMVDYRDLCSKPLQTSDLEGKSLEDLSLIRNTIFAMHGYIFYKNQDVIDYFTKIPWYHQRTDFNETIDLSKMDKENIALVQKFEKQYKKD
jgi:YARHG domain